MRWACVLLSVLLCAGCSGYWAGSHAENQAEPSARQGPDLEPPVISEGFTVFPCPANPGTTIELMACAEHRILRLDEAINEEVRVIFSRLGSRAARRRFVRGERAWLTYRRAVCESRADLFEGGSLAKVVFGDCVADENQAHLKGLRAFERNLRPK